MTPPPTAFGPGNHVVSILVGGWKRRLLVHVPPGRRELEPLPAVVMLAGVGASARWSALETGWPAKADREGFLAVFPEALPVNPRRPARLLTNPQVWNTGVSEHPLRAEDRDDFSFLAEVIRQLTDNFGADPRRIFVTGFSNGAEMVFGLAQKMGDRFAGIAPVAGHYRPSGTPLARPLPTAFLVGTDDPLIPLRGGRVVSPWGAVEDRPAVEYTLRRWAEALGLALPPDTSRPAEGVIQLRYAGPVAYEAFLIEGLGHHWPGGKGQWTVPLAGKPFDRLSATDVIWDFLVKHPG